MNPTSGRLDARALCHMEMRDAPKTGQCCTNLPNLKALRPPVDRCEPTLTPSGNGILSGASAIRQTLVSLPPLMSGVVASAVQRDHKYFKLYLYSLWVRPEEKTGNCARPLIPMQVMGGTLSSELSFAVKFDGMTRSTSTLKRWIRPCGDIWYRGLDPIWSREPARCAVLVPQNFKLLSVDGRPGGS